MWPCKKPVWEVDVCWGLHLDVCNHNYLVMLSTSMQEALCLGSREWQGGNQYTLSCIEYTTTVL